MSSLGDKRSNIPLVSICIPTYNSETYIIDSLESITNQTYSNIEIIVVDDCSSDSTWELVNQYKDNYDGLYSKEGKTIKLYRNEKNVGMSGNWSRAMSLCKGKYVKLICADDMLEASLTEIEVGILENRPEVLCVSSDTRFIDSSGRKRGYYKRYPGSGVIVGSKAVWLSLFTRDYLGAPLANMFRREMYEKLEGFDMSYSYITDYDFFARLYNSGCVYILHRALNYFRIRTDSNTGQVMGGNQGQEYLKEHRKLLEKLAPTMKLSTFQIFVSMTIRRIMSALGTLYIKYSVLGTKV